MEIIDYDRFDMRTSDYFEDSRSKALRPVRSVDLYAMSDVTGIDFVDNFDKALELVDEYFIGLAATIGGTVVNHEWVLIRPLTKPSSFYSDVSHYVGSSESIFLGAIVDFIDGVPFPAPKYSEDGDPLPYDNLAFDNAQKSLSRFNEQHRQTEGWAMCDSAGLRQFMSSSASDPLQLENMQHVREALPVFVDLDIDTIN